MTRNARTRFSELAQPIHGVSACGHGYATAHRPVAMRRARNNRSVQG